MSLRLTTSLREEILARLLARAFSERETALDLKFQALALQVYTRVVVPMKGYSKVKALGSVWVGEKAEFYVQFGEGKNYTKLRLPKPMPFFADQIRNWGLTLEKFESNDELTLQYVRLRGEKDAVRQERVKISRETEAVLASITTAKVLLETWPELGTLCKDLLVEKPKQEVLVPGALNKVFDLPVGKKGGFRSRTLATGLTLSEVSNDPLAQN